MIYRLATFPLLFLHFVCLKEHSRRALTKGKSKKQINEYMTLLFLSLPPPLRLASQPFLVPLRLLLRFSKSSHRLLFSSPSLFCSFIFQPSLSPFPFLYKPLPLLLWLVLPFYFPTLPLLLPLSSPSPFPILLLFIIPVVSFLSVFYGPLAFPFL